eukprot:XP_011677446.1 PREDICTED: plasminogen-like [Strongylocentrotus purpuratus]
MRECYTDIEARDYRGFINTTKNGRACQRWDQQSPHTHDRLSKYPDAGLVENFCRNPDPGDSTAWCYTTDPGKRYEECNLLPLQTSCTEATAESVCSNDPHVTSYSGVVSWTISGRQCQKWSSQFPHAHPYTNYSDHNRCLNIDERLTAWCYTTDPLVPWEYCPVGMYHPACIASNSPSKWRPVVIFKSDNNGTWPKFKEDSFKDYSGFEFDSVDGVEFVDCIKGEACVPNPCLNGGSCIRNATSYFCQCVGPWTGWNCNDESSNLDDIFWSTNHSITVITNTNLDHEEQYSHQVLLKFYKIYDRDNPTFVVIETTG